VTEPRLPPELLRRIMVTPSCWLWTGQISKDGYGVVRLDGRKDVLAHRATYLAAGGAIAEGLVLDHLCHDPAVCVGGRNCIHRRCVRPEHLRAVSLANNSSRNTWAARTHCAHGHALTEENVYHSPASGRICRACKRLTKAREIARQGRFAVPPEEIRQWARANGYDVKPRARLRVEIVRAWNEEHPNRPARDEGTAVPAYEVREWARAHGFDVTPRARLRAEIVSAWNAEHPDRPFTLPGSQTLLVAASEVRSWARTNGFGAIDPRGRLPLDVIAAWNVAHPENRFPGSA